MYDIDARIQWHTRVFFFFLGKLNSSENISEVGEYFRCCMQNICNYSGPTLVSPLKQHSPQSLIITLWMSAPYTLFQHNWFLLENVLSKMWFKKSALQIQHYVWILIIYNILRIMCYDVNWEVLSFSEIIIWIIKRNYFFSFRLKKKKNM